MFKKLIVVAMIVIAACMIMSCQQPNGELPEPDININELPALTDFRGIPSEYFYPDYDETGTPNDFNRGVIDLKKVKGTGIVDEIEPDITYIYESSNQVIMLIKHEVNYNEFYSRCTTYGYFLFTYIKNDAYDNIKDLLNNTTPILSYYLVPSPQGEYSYITKDGEFGGRCVYRPQAGYLFDNESLRRGIAKIEQVFKVEIKDHSFNFKDITDTVEAQAYLGWIIPDHNNMEVYDSSSFSFRTDTDNIYLLPNVYSKYCKEDLDRGVKLDSPVGERYNKSIHGLMSEIGEKVSVIATYKWTREYAPSVNTNEVSEINGAKVNLFLTDPEPIKRY